MKINTDILQLIDTITNVTDTMIILIPAIALYFYYKLHIVDIYILEKSCSGIIIGIHNVTSKSLLFSECSLLINNKSPHVRTINLYEINNNKFINIKSDDIFKIEIDYKLMNITRLNNMRIELFRKHRKIKKILV